MAYRINTHRKLSNRYSICYADHSRIFIFGIVYNFDFILLYKMFDPSGEPPVTHTDLKTTENIAY